MTSKIRVLPPDVVELIAAGEVVERPASAIKELVENSLDAGATALVVAIEGGGLDTIRVTDNGTGIAAEDLRLVFLPHATSKLGRAEELHQVATLGFRGEALASIARVAKVTLLTRQQGQDSGHKVINEGGQMQGITEAACAEGTQITVRDLFFNAPVRRDFMKKPQREAALCAELMAQLILSRPEVAFRFVSDGKQVYQSPGDGSLAGALLSIYGVDSLQALLPVSGQGQGLLISGFVGIGEQARGSRAHQHFFLNGRAVRSPLLARALEEACRHRVMIGRYPLCALSLTLPYESVDINVHPNKWEVRFSREQQVAQVLQEVVEEALQTAPTQAPPPLFERKPTQDLASVARIEPVLGTPTEASPPLRSALFARDSANTTANALVIPPAPPPPDVPAQQLHAPQLRPKQEKLNVLGIAFDTYILATQGERLLLIDQHALHERLLFDRMMAAKDGKQPAQALLLPPVFELDYPDHQAFLAYREALAEAGFAAEDFGGRSLRLVSVPLELGEPLAERSFRDALDELRDRGSLSGRSLRERIIMAACKHAVKGGERLPESALQELVDEMQAQGTTPSCPHGRPIVLELTRHELERRFRRIQG